jgi:predicted Zn-ribbon and HTH transcriptional regulator
MKNLVKTFENFEIDQFGNVDHMQIDHEGHHEAEHYMFFGNLETMHRLIGIMLEMDPQKVDQILKDGHNWAADHIATSKDDIEEVANFLINEMSEHTGELTMDEAYTCESCGCVYEEYDLNEDMTCNECGGQIIMA